MKDLKQDINWDSFFLKVLNETLNKDEGNLKRMNNISQPHLLGNLICIKYIK
mgnify:CR=1 FL=1